MDLFTTITILCIISSLLSFANARWLRLPGVIGVMLLAIIISVATIVLGKSFPAISTFFRDLTAGLDLSRALLDILLGFLLFASALHFDINKLKQDLGSILIVSTVGVVLSALLFGSGLYMLTPLLNIDLPYIFCLLFGALISPTDAVAVAALLKESKMPVRLKTIISGESLFNDGIGIVLFITFLDFAVTPSKAIEPTEITILFCKEVFGGLAVGFLFGWLAQRLMRSISDFSAILLISLTVVMTISVLGGLLHVSVPLAVVIAGLIIGSRPLGKESKEQNNRYLERVWALLDDLLNTVLFVMIGLQMTTVSLSWHYLLLGILTIILLICARGLSLILPLILLKRKLKMHQNSITILTWGGLRGGISIALALSIPDSPYKSIILTCSFIIVVFSVLCQGMSLNKLIAGLFKLDEG